MQATDEQLYAVERFRTGRNLKTFAFAGAGKTSTLAIMAAEARGPGLYLAFNKAIANDARGRFPSRTACATVHSIAFNAIWDEFGSVEKMTGQLNANALVEILELSDLPIGSRHRLSARAQAVLVRGTLERFMQGSGERPMARDVPLLGALKVAPPAVAAELVARTLERARLLWAQMIDPCNPVPLGHDGYLKLWALGRPTLDADYILLDEAQDSSPVVLDVLRRQRAQMIYVGDAHQQIYGWRGAVNAMAEIATPEEAHLTMSFRFGEAIAEAATGVLRALGETRAIRGNSAIESHIGSCAPDAIIARTNAGVVDAVLDALMIAERPYVVGGTSELMRLLRGVELLKQGRSTTAPELFGFDEWGDVLDFAATEEGASLATLVRLVEQHGEVRLMDELEQVAFDETEADVVISTAHKAKGREWPMVQLRDDFDPGSGDLPDPAETRLFYVALTRARSGIDVSPALLARFSADEPVVEAA